MKRYAARLARWLCGHRDHADGLTVVFGDTRKTIRSGCLTLLLGFATPQQPSTIYHPYARCSYIIIGYVSSHH